VGAGRVGMGHIHHAGDALPSPQHTATAGEELACARDLGKILYFGKKSGNPK